jgi:hypothetical protein
MKNDFTHAIDIISLEILALSNNMDGIITVETQHDIQELERAKKLLEEAAASEDEVPMGLLNNKLVPLSDIEYKPHPSEEHTTYCWFCGTELIWGGDNSFEDLMLNGEGIVANHSCPGCGATAEFYTEQEEEGEED